jgi:hypothetical protein
VHPLVDVNTFVYGIKNPPRNTKASSVAARRWACLYTWVDFIEGEDGIETRRKFDLEFEFKEVYSWLKALRLFKPGARFVQAESGTLLSELTTTSL